jgi:hypothetical protein
MQSQIQIDTYIQRTQRYWYVDGLSEIYVGLVILVLGLYYLALDQFAPDTLGALLVGIGQPVIILLAWWPGGRIVRSLKERITYPRTGYVTYPAKRNRRRRLASGAIIAMLVAALVISLETIFQVSQNTLPVIVAAMMALAVAMLGWRFGLARFYVLAAYTLLLGIVTSWLPLVDFQQNAFLFACFGLGWMVSGTYALIHYLRTTNPAEKAEA